MPEPLAQHGIYFDFTSALKEILKRRSPFDQFHIWKTPEGTHWKEVYVAQVCGNFSLWTPKEYVTLKRSQKKKISKFYQDFDYEHE